MSRKKDEGKEGSRAIAKAILEEYQPTTVEEMKDALRDIFGPMFEALLQGEMDAHLGYKSNDRGAKDSSNRRNGYTDKTVKSGMGDIEIRTPRIGRGVSSRRSSRNAQEMSAGSRIRFCRCTPGD